MVGWAPSPVRPSTWRQPEMISLVPEGPVADDRTPLSLDILWFLAHAPEPATLAEIVSGTGHSRTTVDRTLTRLCEAGWVSQEGRPKRFTAGMRVALMGLIMLRSNR